MPLSGCHVIHPRWHEHHRPTATRAMTSTCVITRPIAKGATAADGTWSPAPAQTVYDGPCRVVADSANERLLVTGETQTRSRRYLVIVEHDTEEIKTSDTVKITDAADEGLIGVELRVVDIRYGSEHWQRNLGTEEILRSYP